MKAILTDISLGEALILCVLTAFFIFWYSVNVTVITTETRITNWVALSILGFAGYAVGTKFL